MNRRQLFLIHDNSEYPIDDDFDSDPGIPFEHNSERDAFDRTMLIIRLYSMTKWTNLPADVAGENPSTAVSA